MQRPTPTRRSVHSPSLMQQHYPRARVLSVCFSLPYLRSCRPVPVGNFKGSLFLSLAEKYKVRFSRPSNTLILR